MGDCKVSDKVLGCPKCHKAWEVCEEVANDIARAKRIAKGAQDNGCEIVEKCADGTGPWVRNIRAENAERERDLAIAHDRQPYPTAWAYEQTCRVLEEKRVALAAAEAEVERLTRERDEALSNRLPVPRRERDGKPWTATQAANYWGNKARELEAAFAAERARAEKAEAKLARVEEVVRKWDNSTMTPDGAEWWKCAREDLCAALRSEQPTPNPEVERLKTLLGELEGRTRRNGDMADQAVNAFVLRMLEEVK